MKYLVLHQFRSFGKTLHKGDVVDESEIRTPTLRRAEGKIIPAVSSSKVPADETAPVEPDVAPQQEPKKDDDTSAVAPAAQKKPLLTFKK